MAIDIEFRGIGEDILAGIREAAELTAKLRGEVSATNDAQTKGAQQIIAAQEQVQATLEGSVVAVQELGKQSATQGKALAAELDKAGVSAAKLEGALTEVERTDLQKLVNEAKAVAAAEGATIKPLDAQKKARLEQLAQVKAISKEEANLLGEVVQVTEALQNQPASIEEGAKATLSLKAQLAQAKNEAAAMIAQFGEFSPEAIRATRRAAELKDQIGDLNQRLEALNPDGRGLGAISKLGNVLTNGAQAVGGFFTAFGVGSGQLQEAALKLQSFVLGVQGAKEFFSGFSDALKDVRIALGLTTNAQRVNTIATEADIVAKQGQAGATAAVGTASATASTGIKAFTTALITSPLAPFILVLTAVGAAFALLSRNTKDAQKSYADLKDEISQGFNLKSLDAELDNAKALRGIEEERLRLQTLVKLGKITQADADKQILEAQRVAEKNFDQARRQAIVDRQKSEEAAAVKVQDAYNKLATGSKASDVERRKALEFLGLEEEATAKEIADAYEKMYNDRVNSAKQASIEVTQIDTKQFTDAIGRVDKETQKQQEAADVRKRIREQLAADLIAAEKAITEKLKALEFEAADPEAKLELQRRAAEEEINLLRTNLLRKEALILEEKRIGSTAFQELSDAQKQARADALIDSGAVQTTADQEKEFQKLSLANWDAYYKGVAELAAQNNQTRLALISDNVEREQKEFELGLNQQAEALARAGATEEQILNFRRQKTKEFTSKQEQDARDNEEAIAIARLEAQLAGGDLTVEQQKAIQAAILQVKLDAAKASLAALGEGTDQETQLRRAQLEKLIGELQGQIKQVQANRQPLDMFDLLGITFDNAEQKKAVQDAVGNVINLVEQSIAAQRAEVDAQISATDELIADRERRGQSLQDQLDREIELAKLGLANNIDGVRKQIAENDKAVAADKARKARLIEEQKKFARQQLAIDAAQQASSLITTGANLLANESLKGIVGVIAGIGFFASIFAAFAAFKARANAINNGSTGQQFRKGGSSEGLIEGSRHGSRYGESGIAMVDRNTGKEVGEMEGGEYIVNREVSLKHRDIVEAMNRNDITTVYDLARQEIMGTDTVRLSSERVKEVVETKTKFETVTQTMHVVENDRLVKEVKALRQDVRGFKDQQLRASETSVEFLADGSRVERRPGVVKVVKRVKKIKG